MGNVDDRDAASGIAQLPPECIHRGRLGQPPLVGSDIDFVPAVKIVTVCALAGGKSRPQGADEQPVWIANLTAGTMMEQARQTRQLARGRECMRDRRIARVQS